MNIIRYKYSIIYSHSTIFLPPGLLPDWRERRDDDGKLRIVIKLRHSYNKRQTAK